MLQPPCPRCQKPDPLCVCAWIKPVETQLKVLILQHPQEKSEALGSARIAQLCLPQSKLAVGLSWPNLPAALGQSATPRRWLVFYPGSTKLGAAAKAAAPTPLALVDRAGKLHSPPAASALEGLVLLDGNWRQAKSLWWRNAWLLKLQRAVLLPPRPSLYQRLRREPRREYLSTLESIALALDQLEPQAGAGEVLLEPFSQLLQRYQQRPTD